MTSRRCVVVGILTAVVTCGMTVPALGPGTALAAEAPVKEVLLAHLGWEVDGPEGNVCLSAGGHQCQLAKTSSEAGGFRFPASVAVDNAAAVVSPYHGDVYVVDKGNHRVQVFAPDGTFVSMFGWDVNKTKELGGAPQGELNTCTAASKDVCQAGVEGSAAGQFAFPASVVVDSSTGNVYIEDFFNARIQEFTADGQFVLTFGKEVNATTDKTPGATDAQKNLCTAISKDICKAGELGSAEDLEPSAFKFAQGDGDLLAIDSAIPRLYVGDVRRVQEFNLDGTWTGEIGLSSISSGPNDAVAAIAVDNGGNVFLVYSVNFVSDVIREFTSSGDEIQSFEVAPRRPEAVAIELEVGAIAFDPAGRIAVAEHERGVIEGHAFSVLRGSLNEVEANGLHLTTEFTNEFPTEVELARGLSIAFNEKNEMYVVGGNEVGSFIPLTVAALSPSVATCHPGLDVGTDATLDCELDGTVNPWGVPETEIWFEWAKTATLGFETPTQSVANGVTPVAVDAALVGLIPNETYDFRLAAHDQNIKSPEKLTSDLESLTTPIVPPRIVGQPSVSFVKPFSAVLFGELNPENTSTQYTFQYGSCENLDSCGSVVSTPIAESAAFGEVGTTVEIKDLLANADYRYRLFVENEHKDLRTSEEGSFRTAPAPVPQAITGAARDIGTTSATVSGTVNPDGQPAIYTFELGIYRGSNTQYAVVLSEPAGASSAQVEEATALSGLQPGTTYSYKIAVKSGYGVSQGDPVQFTTAGLSSALTVPGSPGILAVPKTAFPKVNGPKVTPKCKRGSRRDRFGKCVKSKRKVKAGRKGHGRAKKA